MSGQGACEHRRVATPMDRLAFTAARCLECDEMISVEQSVDAMRITATFAAGRPTKVWQLVEGLG